MNALNANGHAATAPPAAAERPLSEIQVTMVFGYHERMQEFPFCADVTGARVYANASRRCMRPTPYAFEQ